MQLLAERVLAMSRFEASNTKQLDNINSSLSKIGDLTTLQTTDKTNLVNAINENATHLAQKAAQEDLNAQKIRIDNLVSTTSGSFYQKSTSGTTGALLVVSSGATTGQINLASVTPVATGYTPIAGDYVLLVYGVASGNAELTDLRVGTDGITDTSAGNAVRRQINKINSKFYDLFAYNKQYIDHTKWTIGQYYSSVNGTNVNIGSNSSYSTQEVDNIPAGTYYFNYISAPFMWFRNRSTGVIKRGSTDYGLTDGAGSVTIPYDFDLFFTTNYHTQDWLDKIMFANAPLPNSYVYGVYNFTLNKTSISALTNMLNQSIDYAPNILTVGSGKQFSTITAAVASITNASLTNRYEILIDNGTYTEYGITLPSFVNLVGASGMRENVIIQGELPVTSDDTTITNTSTINVTGTNKFKDITITGKNMRYPVHSESSGAVTDWIQIVDNCHIEHYGNQAVIDYRTANSLDYSGVWGNCYAWGEGASSGAYAEFTDSLFKAPASGGRAWYVHEAVGMAKPYYHVLKNCILECGASWGVQISESRVSGQLNTVLIDSCQIKGGGIYVQGTYPINVVVSNCGEAPFICASNMFDITHFPQIIGKMDKLKYVGSYTLSGGELLVYDTNASQVNVASSTTDKTLIIGYAVGIVDSNGYVNVCKSKIYPGSTGYDGSLVGISNTTHKPVNYSSGTTIGVSLSSCIKMFY
jgi:hypothetical protein